MTPIPVIPSTATICTTAEAVYSRICPTPSPPRLRTLTWMPRSRLWRVSHTRLNRCFCPPCPAQQLCRKPPTRVGLAEVEGTRSDDDWNRVTPNLLSLLPRLQLARRLIRLLRLRVITTPPLRQECVAGSPREESSVNCSNSRGTRPLQRPQRHHLLREIPRDLDVQGYSKDRLCMQLSRRQRRAFITDRRPKITRWRTWLHLR